jgi:cell division protein FtsN
MPPAASPASEAGPKGLQTGLFGKEENAQAMVSRLGAKGFSASVSQRPVNGATYWAVTVPPGANSSQTILRLKDAGFEAFPIF